MSGELSTGEKLAQSFQVQESSSIMFAAQVIQTVLRQPLPDSAPLHWAPPQLTKIQVKIQNMTSQVADNIYATVGASTSMPTSELTIILAPKVVGIPCLPDVCAYVRTQQRATGVGEKSPH